MSNLIKKVILKFRDINDFGQTCVSPKYNKSKQNGYNNKNINKCKIYNN